MKLNKDGVGAPERMKAKSRWRRALVILAAFLPAVASPSHAQGRGKKAQSASVEVSPLPREIHHQLQVLPFYSVFDNVAFTLKGSEVTLTGQVLRATLRTQAVTAVKSLEGVTSVVNHIELLPVSPTDDELRRAVYRAIYENPDLARFAVQAVPPIHIIVKYGNVTLEGRVESVEDKNLAAARADAVPNVRGVANNLVVPSRGSEAE